MANVTVTTAAPALSGPWDGGKCLFQGLALPLFGDSEMEWPNIIRLILYLMGLAWIFLAVGLISDVFMNGIEKITSSKKRVKEKGTGKTYTVYVWNSTVANLSLMALGSSAPEILLSLIEISSDEFFLGPLGAGTIVGSAAFNLLIISAVCVTAIPDGEIRVIKDTHVYIVTAVCSVGAYLWLMFILMVTSPDVCDLWEALVTLLFTPLLIIVAYFADRGYFKGKEAKEELEACAHSTGQTIPDDATEEELAAIEQDIRTKHGQGLSQEQVIKIMKVEYFNKRSRAYYRHAAMEAKLHGKPANIKPVCSVTEALACSDDLQAKKTIVLGFVTEKYAVTESCGKVKVMIGRAGPADCKASVKYISKEGTAKAVSDYVHVEGTMTFEKDEISKMLEITILDDTAFENDEYFTVELSDPTCESKEYTASLTHNVVTIVIIDDDQPGELRFMTEEVPAQDEGAEKVIDVTVQRYDGATGEISCLYHCDTMNAVEGIDFQSSKGTLTFENGQTSAKIQVTINPRSRAKAAAFNVVLEEPQGTKFDAKTDGGEEKCICHVTIEPQKCAEGKNISVSMRERVMSANAIAGSKNWSQQFRDALFDVGGGDDDEEEGEEPAGPKEGPSKVDLFVHILTVPWKLLFAFVPPVDYCGGWLCFCCALAMIAVVTALVGDMANLVGCTLDILPETAAITFVALGTSLPDTFASKTAAMMDPTADASIGNITGSNAINVFMGVGLSWALAAILWEVADPAASDEWYKRVAGMDPAVQKNVFASAGCTVGKAACDKVVFITPAGTLWFNLMVFSVNALCALQHLFARRKKFGGELGGPKSGFMGQYFSAGFLMFQWFIYVVASIIFARVNDGLSYTALSAK